MKTILFTLFILKMCVPLFGQEIPMGAWRSHFNYKRTTWLAKSLSKIYAGGAYGLMIFDRTDGSLSKLSKVDGLSEVDVTAMAFDAKGQRLVLGYRNGNIDLMTKGGMTNNPSLLNSKTTDNKTIHHFSFHQGVAYVSTDFGVLALNMQSGKISEAYQNLGEKGAKLQVRASVIRGSEIFLATPQGVLSAPLASGTNLQDFNEWQRYKGSLVHRKNIRAIALYQGEVYAGTSKRLFQFQQRTWREVPLALAANDTLRQLTQGIQRLFLITQQNVYVLANGALSTINGIPEREKIKSLIQTEPQTYWYADDTKGLVRLKDGKAQTFLLDGPVSNHMGRLQVMRGVVYAFPKLEQTGSFSNGLGLSTFAYGAWTTLKPSELGGQTNVSGAAYVGEDLYYSSLSKGVYNASKATLYEPSNSPLVYSKPGNHLLVSGLAADPTQNLWVAHQGSTPLLKRQPDGQWQSFRFGSSTAKNKPSTVAVNGSLVWLTLSAGGILVYHTAKATHRLLNTSSAGLPSDRVNDVAFSKRHEAWIATDKGVVYLPFAPGVVENTASKAIKPVFGSSYLFKDKKVTAIALDGGDRKWIGTTQGIWLYSKSMDRLIHHFTAANSPLPADSIQAIAIHPLSGEVFVATTKGLVSYRAEATEGASTHQAVKIFPNPVLPGFQGLVGFSGLVHDAIVKITTVAGSLVKQIYAAGGGAAWDVSDINGRRVDTGVYLVFSSTKSGAETFVGKIAVVN